MDEKEESVAVDSFLGAITESWYLEITVPVNFQIDTGGDVSVIQEALPGDTSTTSRAHLEIPHHT